MSYKGLLQSFLSAIFFLALFVGEAAATDYEYIWTPPQKLTGDCFSAGNGRAGSLKRLETRYNSALHTLSWEATFSACNGSILPDGFRLAMNHGENPKAADAKELAFMYFDASHMFTGLNENPAPAPNHPILTVYEYTNGNSYQTGAPILSNHPSAPASDFIIDIYAKNNADGTRSLGFVIDATDIKEFHNTDKWWGVGYSNLLGFWWHPTNGTATTYCDGVDPQPAFCAGHVGFLKTFSYVKLGWYDTQDRTTNKRPFCVTKFDNQWQNNPTARTAKKACVTVEIGEDFEAYVIGDDGNDDQLVPTHSGSPAGSTLKIGAVDIAENNATPYDVPVNVAFGWTPQLADAGSNHTVVVTFTDDGFPNTANSTADISCEIPLCVPKNDPPECDLQITTKKDGEDFQCAGEKTDIEFSATGSVDPEMGALKYTWDVVCEDEDSNAVTEMFQESPNGTTATLSVGTPWEPGKKVSCKIVMTVADNLDQTSQCEVEVAVDPCSRDCLDKPNGDAVLDQCGVCDGNNACLDCLGVPNGDAKYDSCGVCEGTDSCLDCFDVPFGSSELDRCGVCDGDGNSCLDCSDTDITSIQFELDGGADAQRNMIKRALKRLLQKDDSTKQRKFAKNARAQADALYLENWTLTWSMPQIFTQCANVEFCVPADNSQTLEEYESNSQKLLTLNTSVIKRIREIAGAKKKRGKLRGSKILKNARGQHRENLKRSSSVPKSESVCS